MLACLKMNDDDHDDDDDDDECERLSVWAKGRKSSVRICIPFRRARRASSTCSYPPTAALKYAHHWAFFLTSMWDEDEEYVQCIFNVCF